MGATNYPENEGASSERVTQKKEMEISVQVKLFKVKVDVVHAMSYRLQVRVKIKFLPRIHSKCRLQFPVNSTRVHFWKLMAFRSR